jgi:hypothetical protein
MKPPKVIYLQWSDEYTEETTWCIDPVAEENQVDVKYIQENHQREEELKEVIEELLEACKYARTGYINLIEFQILPSEEYDKVSQKIADRLEEITVKTNKIINQQSKI